MEVNKFNKTSAPWEHGIFWIGKFSNFQGCGINFLTKVYKKPFAVLTIGQLEAGFAVSLVPLVLSAFVLDLEWTLTLRSLIGFLYIFKNYFEVKDFERSMY